MQIQSHTGLRGAAALLVVLYHLQALPNHLALEDLTWLPRRGYLMVDLFFVLSGFIISHVYAPSAERPLRAGEFLIKRLIRLYPLHLFCLGYLVLGRLALQVVLTLAGHPPGEPGANDGPTALVIQVFLLNAFTPLPNGWNIPTWSISAELFAYATFPLMIMLLQRWPGFARVAFGLFSAGFYAWAWQVHGTLDVTSWPAPLRCLAGFLLGILVYSGRARLARLNQDWIGAAQALVLAMIAAMLVWPVPDVLIMPAFVLLVALTAHDKGWLARTLARPIPQYLGEISYSVYLNHVCFLSLFYQVWIRLAERIGLTAEAERGLLIVLVMASVVGLSHLTYRYVELPSRGFLMRWLNNRPRAVRPATH